MLQFRIAYKHSFTSTVTYIPLTVRPDLCLLLSRSLRRWWWVKPRSCWTYWQPVQTWNTSHMKLSLLEVLFGNTGIFYQMTSFINWSLQMKSAGWAGCNVSGPRAVYTVIDISSTSWCFVAGSCDISCIFPVLAVGNRIYRSDRAENLTSRSCEHGMARSAFHNKMGCGQPSDYQLYK